MAGRVKSLWSIALYINVTLLSLEILLPCPCPSREESDMLCDVGIPAIHIEMARRREVGTEISGGGSFSDRRS